MTTETDIIRPEHRAPMLGVPGRFFTLRRPPAPWRPGTFANQTWCSESRSISGYGREAVIHVEARFDDNCRNGHNTFGITAEVRLLGQNAIVAGGVMHDEIARVFPDLAPLLPWHLTSTDGPMHYPASAVYFAGDRDHYGLRKGERRQLRNGKTGRPSWRLATLDAAGNEVPRADLEQYVDAVQAPAESWRLAYVPRERVGEGKARELDAARRVAVWPEATDADLCAEPDELRAVLNARLPALLARFRVDMERAGFVWQCD